MATEGRQRLLGLMNLVLSHHSASQVSRTIGVRILGREQRFCSRCSGQWTATAACVSLMLVFNVEFTLAVWLAVLALLPMPALLDWVTQTWGTRESTTPFRLITGSMLGVGVGFEIVAGARLDWAAFAGGIGVATGYALAIFLLLRLRPPKADYMVDLVEEATRIVNRPRVTPSAD